MQFLPYLPVVKGQDKFSAYILTFTIYVTRGGSRIKSHDISYLVGLGWFRMNKDLSFLVPYCMTLSNYFCLFFGFRAAPLAYGSSWARGSNWSCSCWPMPQPQQHSFWATSATCATACGNAGSLTPWARPGIEPASSQPLYQVLNLLSHNRNSPVNIAGCHQVPMLWRIQEMSDKIHVHREFIIITTNSGSSTVWRRVFAFVNWI